MGNVVALVGAQYGSEGKGTIAYHLAEDFDIHVRTGAPNAGHTIRHRGRDWKMRSIPCGWVDSHAKLVIGAGALVDLDLLQNEVAEIEASGPSIRDRLYLDPKAVVIDPVRHHMFEGGVEGEAHRKIGSTGEGVGPARMAHMARNTFPGDSAWSRVDHLSDYKNTLHRRGFQLIDTSRWLHEQLQDDDTNVLLEGTQGSGLSLVHGPWPYVTSCDTNTTQMLTDAGIAPHYLTETILVARTFPIRVAGNSGPLVGELSWDELGLDPERTTVTDKVRRVGVWDDALIEKAVRLNEPCCMALTFVDYLWPDLQGKTDRADIPEDHPVWDFVRQIEDMHEIRIAYLGTGSIEGRFAVVER